MKILIDNMSCNHCVMRIKEALSEVGIKRVKFDLQKRIIQVNLKDISLDVVKKAVNDIGYNFEVLE